jgi:hypothetical protein
MAKDEAMPPEDQEQQPPTFKRLQAIIDGDGTEIRRQFTLAGLLLTIVERFKEYAVAQVDSFFAHRFEFRDGELSVIRGAAFKAMIKEKGKGQPGQHANRDFRAALHWFREMNAIDQHEMDEVERLYARRNEIGHELFAIIADDRKEPLKPSDVAMALGIYVKMVRWWIREIDATTDPDMTREKYDSINWDAVESADTAFLRLILQKALAGDPEWEALQDAVREYVKADDEAAKNVGE